MSSSTVSYSQADKPNLQAWTDGDRHWQVNARSSYILQTVIKNVFYLLKWQKKTTLHWLQFICCVMLSTNLSCFFSRHRIVIISAAQPGRTQHAIVLASRCHDDGGSLPLSWPSQWTELQYHRLHIEAHLYWKKLSLMVSGMIQCSLPPKEHILFTADWMNSSNIRVLWTAGHLSCCFYSNYDSTSKHIFLVAAVFSSTRY